MSNFYATNASLKALIILFFPLLTLTAYSQTVVSTLAGNGTPGFADGIAANAEFDGPNGVAIDLAGNVYIGDNHNSRVRKYKTDGNVITAAGNGVYGFVDGIASNAEFRNPQGVDVDVQGNVYVADASNNCIRKITPSGIVSTVAGNGIAGYVDGNGANAEFNHPVRVNVDKNGILYVSDIVNNRIRKITSDGVVSTFAGNGVAGYADGTVLNAEFNAPDGVAFDTLGNIYVADYGDNHIRKIDTFGIVTTIAGNGIAGHVDGAALNAEFNAPSGICIDKIGNFYVPDELGNYIRKIDTSGMVSTIAGNGVAGFADGNATDAEFYNPRTIKIDKDGNLYTADYNNNRIRKITLGVLPITLINFTAQLSKNNCVLSWQTATEINTSYFNIQRSSDGLHYNTINKINAAGNSSNTNNYSYSDVGVNELSVSKLYYRLQEVDKDGKSNYSNIRTVNLLNGHSLFSVSPNPSKDFIHITASYNVSAAQVNITDMNGKTLFTTQQNFVAGQQLKVLLSQFPSGVLIVNIKSSNSNEKFKIIKE